MIENFQKKARITDPKEKKARKYLIQQLRASRYTVNEICILLDDIKGNLVFVNEDFDGKF